MTRTDRVTLRLTAAQKVLLDLACERAHTGQAELLIGLLRAEADCHVQANPADEAMADALAAVMLEAEDTHRRGRPARAAR